MHTMRYRRWVRPLTTLALTAAIAASAASSPALAEEASSGHSKSIAPQTDLTGSARSAILMDADSGTVIFEKNSSAALPPASITKIMTMLLVMEALDEGRIKLTDKVQTSEYAASMGGSQIFLEPGEEMTVEDMLKGVALASGNDASVALAEKLAGSEEEFVKRMNEKAKELGMTSTHFVNCNGLPASGHVSSARDIALMSRELLKHEEITKYTGLYQDYLRKDKPKPFWLVNTNKLVRFYNGADGLKTGFTGEAKFCLSATAKRDNLRLIAVVMGEPNTKTRNAEVSKLFDYAFAQFTNVPIYKKGDTIGSLQVQKGETAKLPIVAKHSYSVLVRKGDSKGNIRHELVLDKKLTAPVKAGQQVGKLIVYRGNEVMNEFPIEAPASVDRAGWWTLFKRSAGKLFLND
ncbi:D-alanyl-D-alanine carboxypeptidase family protein [Cohnella thailandensis]|uniref:serine-type D-Ala-D-Ala carboxypeptidase n=1 Tax=Cohnella thailandensis TaxID=557557 RepID=A0A841SU62_9BACL|nr:D-alanyl-D-alanine carboxypeptidase family protein [Cohnella thailandensis]MBB6635464.1 D-alanyl-D-alanine carboxypeptidase [Cohnella thailandensis]MBP1974844.1 D-alanyl-D-alanine carboxypeptidase (penicillin-binding protein 5/6) [Cohnella thailandensis]